MGNCLFVKNNKVGIDTGVPQEYTTRQNVRDIIQMIDDMQEDDEISEYMYYRVGNQFIERKC
jgi:hypothetical protein